MEVSVSPSSFEILAEAPFFSGLSREQLQEVKALCRIEAFPQGSHIYVLGKPAEDFYVLVDGMVRFALGMGTWQMSAGEIIRPGQVFGWAALLEKAQTRIANAYCMTPCVVLAINGTEMLRLMEQNHSLGYVLMRRLNVLITGELTAFAAG
jgi:CRP-like cAMP-binding protein